MATPLIRSTICPVLILLACSAHAWAKDYTITLKRPLKVGDQYRATVESKSKTASGTKVTQLAADLEGVMKVLAVNEQTGNPTQLSCEVKKLTRDGKELYPAGTTIVAERTSDESKFKINGQDASADDTHVLRQVIDLSNPAATVSDDEAFGTKEPQKTGGTWSISKDSTSKQLNEAGIPVDAGNVSGEGKLSGIEKIGDTETAVVDYTVSGTSIHGNMKNGRRILDGNIKLTIEEKLPVDGTTSPVYLKAKLHLSQVFSNPKGATRISVSVDTEMTEKIEMLKQP